jgi:hypothetical protein
MTEQEQAKMDAIRQRLHPRKRADFDEAGEVPIELHTLFVPLKTPIAPEYAECLEASARLDVELRKNYNEAVRREMAKTEAALLDDSPGCTTAVIVKVPNKLLQFVDEAVGESFTLIGSFPTADAASEVNERVEGPSPLLKSAELHEIWHEIEKSQER